MEGIIEEAAETGLFTFRGGLLSDFGSRGEGTELPIAAAQIRRTSYASHGRAAGRTNCPERPLLISHGDCRIVGTSGSPRSPRRNDRPGKILRLAIDPERIGEAGFLRCIR